MKRHINNKQLTTYRRLLNFSSVYWLSFVIGVLATVVLSLSDAGFTYLIKPIVNKGFIDRDGFFIHLLPILILLIFLLRAVASFSSSYFIANVARSVVRDVRCLLFRQLMRLPASFYDKHPSGKLLSRLIYNVEQIAEASSDVLITVLREVSLVIGLLGVMFVLNWRLSLLFVTVTPLIAWGLKVCSRRLRQLSSHVQSSVGQVSHLIKESLDAYKIIRLFGGQHYEAQKFDTATRKNRQQELKVAITNSIGSSIIQLLIAIPLVFILYLATSTALNISAGDFAAVLTAMIMLIRPVRRITGFNNLIQKGLAGAASVFELLDESPELDSGAVKLSRAKGSIRYQDVCFTYPGTARAVLQGINFSVNPGETIAIVGHSGGGKSTLINMLPRFYEMASGNILIDGLDIREYRLADLRRQFAMVSQHTVLFNDTVARNIAYAAGEAIDQQRLLQAAESANATAFIQQLPQGFDSVIGEQGLLLSGGQRQRIAIARALYKQAPILILDEATSALDTRSEALIQNALANLMQQSTTLVIAHRLSTIENADRIIVVDQGTIVASGKHQELLAQQGIYSELHRQQCKP